MSNWLNENQYHVFMHIIHNLQIVEYFLLTMWSTIIGFGYLRKCAGSGTLISAILRAQWYLFRKICCFSHAEHVGSCRCKDGPEVSLPRGYWPPAQAGGATSGIPGAWLRRSANLTCWVCSHWDPSLQSPDKDKLPMKIGIIKMADQLGQNL